VLFGRPIGIGGYTFVYAGGSYLTNNPKACLKRLTYPWHKGLKVPAQNEAYASPSRCGLKRSG